MFQVLLYTCIFSQNLPECVFCFCCECITFFLCARFDKPPLLSFPLMWSCPGFAVIFIPQFIFQAPSPCYAHHLQFHLSPFLYFQPLANVLAVIALNSSYSIMHTITSEWCILVWRSRWIVLCVGIFHESEGRMKYPYTKTMKLDLQTRKHHELVLVFMPYYFCFDYIMFNVQF